MSKILVIPDIHNRINIAQAILDVEAKNVDKVLFLGDFFDSWGDSEDTARNTALFLKELLEHDDYIFIFSNHDLGYAYPRNSYAQCSGFSKAKCQVINSIIGYNDWLKFKFLHIEDKVIYSHAGINESLFSHPEKWEITEKHLLKEQKKAFINLEAGMGHYFYQCGRARGGFFPFGGCVWAHWKAETDVLEDFNTISGHTIIKTPEVVYRKEKNKPKTWSLNLDTNSKHYAIVTDGVFEVREVSFM